MRIDYMNMTPKQIDSSHVSQVQTTRWTRRTDGKR